MPKTISESQEQFLREMAVGLLPRSVRTYQNGLKRFNEYLATRHLSPASPVSKLRVEHAIEFGVYIAETNDNHERGVNKSSLRTYLSAISQYYSFILVKRFVTFDARDLENLRQTFHKYRRGYSRPLPKLPHRSAIHSLLQAARDVPSNPKKPRLELVRLRNITILEALRASGMRVGELVGLRRGDLDHQSRSARVVGKGDKERNVYFDDVAWATIQAYLQARADGASGRALAQLPVFARHDRRAANRILPITTDAVRLVFNTLARQANLDIRFTPHSFRHAFATRVLEDTNDLAVVQDLLGHASPVTTRIYAKVSTKRLREVHRRVFDSRREEDE